MIRFRRCIFYTAYMSSFQPANTGQRLKAMRVAKAGLMRDMFQASSGVENYFHAVASKSHLNRQYDADITMKQADRCICFLHMSAIRCRNNIISA